MAGDAVLYADIVELRFVLGAHLGLKDVIVLDYEASRKTELRTILGVLASLQLLDRTIMVVTDHTISQEARLLVRWYRIPTTRVDPHSPSKSKSKLFARLVRYVLVKRQS